MVRNLRCPPRSQSFIVTFPFVTFLILNPTWFSEIWTCSLYFNSPNKKKEQRDSFYRIIWSRNPRLLIKVGYLQLESCPQYSLLTGTIAKEKIIIITKKEKEQKTKNKMEVRKTLTDTGKKFRDLLFTHSNGIDKRCFSSVLKAYKGKFHFLFKK